jgi:hypothetical protein
MLRQFLFNGGARFITARVKLSNTIVVEIDLNASNCKLFGFQPLRRNPTTYPKGQLSQRSGLG